MFLSTRIRRYIPPLHKTLFLPNLSSPTPSNAMVLDKYDNDDGGICFFKKSFGLYPLKKNDFSLTLEKFLDILF